MKKINNPQKYITTIVFAVMILSYTYVCMTKYCFASAMVFIVDEGIMTNFQTGLITSAFWLVYAVTQLFGGMIADRWHPERLITFGLVSAGVANTVILFCYENYSLTLIVWMLNAFCQFGVWPSVFKIISSMYSGQSLTNAMTVATLASPAGLMLNYAVAAIVPRWQDNFTVSFVGLFVTALLWEITSRRNKDYINSLKLTDIKKKAVDEAKISASYGKQVMTMAKLMSVSGLVFVFALAFFRSLVDNMRSFVPSMISESYQQVDPSMSTFMTLIPLFCGAVAPIFSSFLSKRVGNEMKVVTVIFATILPVSLVTLLLGTVNCWFIVVSMAFVTFGASATTFFITTLTATKFNKWGKGATVAGILNAFTAIGNVVAGALMTWIADEFSWHLTLVMMVVFIVISFALALTELPIWNRFKKNYYEKE